MKIVSPQEKNSTEEALFSFIKSVFLRYFSCWSAWGLLFYLWSMGCWLCVVISLKQGELGNFVAFFIGMVFCYFLGKPFMMLFYWSTQKARQAEKQSRMNWIAVLIAVGLFLYPFVSAVMTGGIMRLFEVIGDDLDHLDAFFTRPESIFTYLILAVVIFIAFWIAALFTYPVSTLCAIIFMVIWLLMRKKIVAYLSFKGSCLLQYIKKRMFRKKLLKKADHS